MNKFILIFASFSLLTACFGDPTKKIEIFSTNKDFEITQPPRPKQLELRETKFKILTNTEILALADELKKTNKKIELFVLTKDGMDNYLFNYKELAVYLEKQDAIIGYYENITKNNVDKEANKVNKD